jgi:hypothetical protein
VYTHPRNSGPSKTISIFVFAMLIYLHISWKRASALCKKIAEREIIRPEKEVSCTSKARVNFSNHPE